MNETDMELVRRYAHENAEDAFAELVRRHLDLVHSAAFRQVRSAHLAQEVAQSVFIDLARNAKHLAPKTVLTAWFYEVTRRTAIDVVRRESRRELREQVAHQLETMNSTEPEWKEIEPLLEDAMGTLESADRTAVLLRYFENKSLREVGEALGASENAAQKRVSRAIEQLHRFFRSKGVAASTSGLGILLSTRAVQSVPSQVATAITTAAIQGAAVGITTVSAAIKTVLMTTTQKTLVLTAFFAALGTALYEAREASRLRTQVRHLEAQLPLLADADKVTRERDDATNQLAALRVENEQWKRNSAELLRLRAEVTQLRNDSRLALFNGGDFTGNQTTDTNSLQYVLQILSAKDSNEITDSTRFDAAEKLRSFGSEAVEALPAFVELLYSDTEDKRYGGARALAFISEKSPDAVQQLTSALADGNPEVRDAATHGVGILFNYDFKNVDSSALLQNVLLNLDDSSRTVRADTIQALRQYIDRQHWSGKEAQPELLIPKLIARLTDGYSYARVNAALALGEYGEKAQRRSNEFLQTDQ